MRANTRSSVVAILAESLIGGLYHLLLNIKKIVVMTLKLHRFCTLHCMNLILTIRIDLSVLSLDIKTAA